MIREALGSTQALFIGSDTDFSAAAFSGQYDILLQRFPEIRMLAHTEQVHGDTAVEIRSGVERLYYAGEADALYTRELDAALLIRTADCIPILFHSEGESLIGAVHAGWRGLEKKILTKTLAAARATVAGLQFIVGPFIGEASYEVGADVADRFDARFQSARENGKFLLNLKAVLRHELRSLGVAEDQVIWHDADTLVSPDWHSARRGDQKRNLSLIWRAAD